MTAVYVSECEPDKRAQGESLLLFKSRFQPNESLLRNVNKITSAFNPLSRREKAKMRGINQMPTLYIPLTSVLSHKERELYDTLQRGKGGYC